MKFNRQKVNIFFIFVLILNLSINDVVSGEDGLVMVENTTDTSSYPSSSPSSSAWSITVLADFHGAESFANNPNPSTNNHYQDYLKTLSYIQNTYDGGDVVMLPGDSNTGRWWNPKYINRFFKGQSPKDVVYQASINCYRTLKLLLEETGYSIALMAIGDHELGDNGWVVGYPKTLLIEDYRQGFRHGFNSDYDNKFLYKDNIVANDYLVASSTPLGTDHQFLSYAYQHENVLFITIDIYEQMSTFTNYINKPKGRGGEGVITGTMRNEHLEWFEQVLRVGRESSSIKHIIVQAHIPVKEPVRKIRSSAMSVDDGVQSDFWKLMVQYGVDLYLAGEVHATTCTKDDNSNLVQIASRANALNGFLKILVEDNKLTVFRYSEVGPKPRHNRNYELSGMLSIDKSNEVVQINSSGALELVDLSKALIRFSFDDKYPMETRPIEGLFQMKDMKEKIGLFAKSTLMRGVESTQSLPNLGIFGQPYDAQVANLRLFRAKAISGKKSAYFNGSTSRHSIYSFGPLSAVTNISYSLWVRTKKSREMILVHYGAAWSNSWFDSIRSSFTLTMANGIPKLYARENSFLTTKKLKLNDGQWHHIAISMPKSNCKLSKVGLYIDGRPQITKVQNDETLFFLSYGRVSLGGLGYSSPDYEQRYPHWNSYQGGMDEFILWSRSIDYEDLAWSMNKNFRMIWGSSCGETNDMLVLDTNTTKAECKQRCKNRSNCFGFEGTTLNDGYNQCSLYKDRPSKGLKREKTVCAITM